MKNKTMKGRKEKKVLYMLFIAIDSWDNRFEWFGAIAIAFTEQKPERTHNNSKKNIDGKCHSQAGTFFGATFFPFQKSLILCTAKTAEQIALCAREFIAYSENIGTHKYNGSTICVRQQMQDLWLRRLY